MTEQNPLQRTPEWYQDRVGCLTGSRAYPVLRPLKKTGDHYQDYYDLIDELVSERITGTAAYHPQTAAMLHGIETEPVARDAYENLTGELVDLVGFVSHPEIHWLGASPDGLVGSEGLVEIKCLDTTNHIDVVAEGIVPEKYKAQLLVQLLVTGRKWCDMCFFDDRLPEKWAAARCFVVRYEPTQAELDEALTKFKEFLEVVEKATAEKTEKLNRVLEAK